jgi:hypothetical protein
MLLDDTSSTIQVLLAAAVTTNQLPVSSWYADHGASSFTPGANVTTTNGTTAVTAVAAPGASTQRQIKNITIFNRDTVDATVTVRYNDGTNTFNMISVTLHPNDTLNFVDKMGWKIIDVYGMIRQVGGIIQPHPTLRLPVGQAASSTGVKSITSTSTFAVYLGRAERNFSSVMTRFRVTTAPGGTITWAECALATGTPVLGGNATLTTLAYTDVSAVVNTTGIKDVTITYSGYAGQELWFLIGVENTTTTMVVRAGQADDITSGWQQVATTTRPSTMAANTAFTLEANTVTPITVSHQVM